MICKFKNYFKNFLNNEKFYKIKNSGNKIYLNTIKDVYFKKNYKFNKYIVGYNYNISSYNFNSLHVNFLIIDKKNREYVKFNKYINFYDNSIIFFKNK